MAKKKEETNGIFSEDVLAKLQNTKKELQQEERQRAEEAEVQRQFERKQREENLSFEELLDRHGNQGGKF